MTAVAYIANEFPSALEPYVVDEVLELRRRGVEVICCSGKRSSPKLLQKQELELWENTLFFQPLPDDELLRAIRRLISSGPKLGEIIVPLIREHQTGLVRRLRTVGHSVMGAALAEKLAPLGVTHIHAHHGYFAAWMALTASSLLGIDFSFTLHGSDLLQRGDLLAVKLRASRFCVTISDYNRRYILSHYPETAADKVLVQRLGVDRVLPWPLLAVPLNETPAPLAMLSIGRLHPVKDHRFLVEACAMLRQQSFAFTCRIAGAGPERESLQALIDELKVGAFITLLGHLSHTQLLEQYRSSDLVVMTSKSEGIPVVLMEAMAYQKLVLAPAITGIPELIEHQRTGFLYEQGSLRDFVSAIRWIANHQHSLDNVRRAAAASVAASYDRQRSLTSFSDQFLARISNPKESYAHTLLQQVQLPV